jgi:hypothetical protein
VRNNIPVIILKQRNKQTQLGLRTMQVSAFSMENSMLLERYRKLVAAHSE